jgi:hypothetical protein
MEFRMPMEKLVGSEIEHLFSPLLLDVSADDPFSILPCTDLATEFNIPPVTDFPLFDTLAQSLLSFLCIQRSESLQFSEVGIQILLGDPNAYVISGCSYPITGFWYSCRLKDIGVIEYRADGIT